MFIIHMPVKYINLSSLSANPQYKATMTDEELYESLIINNNKFKKNNLIKIMLIKINLGPLPVTLQYDTSQRYEFIVKNQTGREIWRWSKDKFFTPIAESITLNSGESKVYSVIWNIPKEIESGFYIVEGWNAAKELKQIKFSMPVTIIP